MRGSPKSGKRRSPTGPRRPPWRLSAQQRELVAALIADPPRRYRNAGRRRYPPLACLEGILYVRYTGCRYVDVPRELGLPSGETCRRRLHEWIERGVWPQLLLLLIEQLDKAGKLDWSRLVVDASIIDAKRGAILSAPAR